MSIVCFFVWKGTVAAVLGSGLFFFEFAISCVGFEVGNIDKVVYASFDVSNSRLIGCEAPLVVDDEFKSMLASLEIVNVCKVIARSMHGNLPGPAIESSCNIYLPSPVFPAKDSGYSIIVQPVFKIRNVSDRIWRVLGVHIDVRDLVRIHHGHRCVG